MGIKTHVTVGVNRLLARVSFGDTPVKLQHLIPELKVAMDRGVAKFSSQRYAPNHFILYMAVGDVASHAPLLDAFRHAVIEELGQRSADKGWALLADSVSIDVQPWDELSPGDFRIDARIIEARTAGELPLPTPPQPDPMPDGGQGHADDKTVVVAQTPPDEKTAPAVPRAPVDGATAIAAPRATALASPLTRRLMDLEDAPTDVATAVFKIIRGAKPGQVLVLVGREAVAGRGDDAQLRIDDDRASRRHARLFLEDGKLGVEDLGSTAGTLLNGVRVDRGWLKAGARLQIGDTVLELMYLPGVSS